MAHEERFTWRLHVDDDDEESRTLDLTGDAADLAALRHDLTDAVTRALAHFDPHDEPIGDEEDGWELRAAPLPPPKRP
ncbi:MAG: hypothetical protein QOG77_2774 [Solirubrobacteraceae bacterium]|jgi:hypothetical protein|nr:hypothetical protein [Solirubrobacteraceae bacterium]